MAGILPNGGVQPGETQNGDPTAELVPGCANLYYGPRCNPRLDPFAMNAVISELMNAINGGEIVYDCERLDNLQLALSNYSKLHVLSVARETGAPTTYALPIGSPGAQITIATGSIVIPNTADYTIPASLTVATHAQVQSNQADVRWTFGMWVYTDVALSSQLLNTHFASISDGSSAPRDMFDAYGANVAFLDVPPGGRTLYYKFAGSASASGVSATETFGRFMIYGAGTPTGFTIDT